MVSSDDEQMNRAGTGSVGDQPRDTPVSSHRVPSMWVIA